METIKRLEMEIDSLKKVQKASISEEFQQVDK